MAVDSHNGANGNGAQPPRRTMTRPEAEAVLVREARDLLDLSPDEALAKLHRGELEGTAAEAELRMLEYLVRG